MANLNSMEMSAALSNDSRISIKKSLFSKKAIYNNTQSTIKFEKKEYTADEGARIQQFFRGSADEIAKRAEAVSKFQETGLGNYLVEMGISDDHNFMVACLYHYDQLRYKPTTEVLVFEGKAAQKVVEKF